MELQRNANAFLSGELDRRAEKLSRGGTIRKGTNQKGILSLSSRDIAKKGFPDPPTDGGKGGLKEENIPKRRHPSLIKALGRRPNVSCCKRKSIRNYSGEKIFRNTSHEETSSPEKTKGVISTKRT